MSKGNGTDIIIVNNSGEIIKDISITTSEKIKTIYLDALESDKTYTTFLSMMENKTDGSYIIKYKINNEFKEIKNGYYTNGSSLNNWIKFTIKKDTTLIEFSKSRIEY